MANPELYLDPKKSSSWYWVYAVWGGAAVYFTYSYATGGFEAPKREAQKPV